jgi:uncharacterized protein YndB with AHSA1/START domain
VCRAKTVGVVVSVCTIREDLMTQDQEAAGDERELVFAREMVGTPAMLFRAWSEPDLLKRWFAPRPWQCVQFDLDLRVGGGSHVIMRSPEGADFPSRGVYLEVERDRKIVFTDAYTEGWRPSETPFITAIVTFDDLGNGRTLYTARVRHWTKADRERHESMGFHAGWSAAADQLQDVVSGL